MPHPEPDEFLTIGELAARLRKPVNTLYRWNSRNEGPAYLRVGRTVLYRRTDVEKWLQSRYAGAGVV